MATSRPVGDRPVLVGVTAAWGAIVVGVLVLWALTGLHPLDLFSEEIARRGGGFRYHGFWYRGILSALSVAMLATTAVLLLARKDRALRALGVFTVLVAIDDATGLLEGALRQLTRAPDVAGRALFVAAAAAVAARYGRALLAQPHARVLAAAAVTLAVSLAIDLAGPQLPEELLELLGEGYWLAFAVLVAVRPGGTWPGAPSHRGRVPGRMAGRADGASGGERV